MRFVTIEELTTASKALTHNSTLDDSEPAWGGLDKTKLPRKAFADQGEPNEVSTWKYPHHWVSGGSKTDDNGRFTDGTMYLHKGGLNAAWAAANGARSGQEASSSVISHLKSHRDALGLSDKAEAIELKFKSASDSDEHRIVYGVVYTPGYLDTDWETISAEDVQKMAWNFLAQRSADSIDIQHNLEKSGCEVVESFIARAGDPDFPEGSWVLGVRCTPETWKRVKKGELNGFSLYGQVAKYPAKVMLEVAKQISGITEESTVDILPIHDHSFMLNLNSKGQIVAGRTDTKLGHFHKITMGTATETALDHNHRYFSE